MSAISLMESLPTGTLSPLPTAFTPSVYPGTGHSAGRNRRLYACGGISNGGNKILGYGVAPDGTLTRSPACRSCRRQFAGLFDMLFGQWHSVHRARQRRDRAGSFTLDAAGVPIDGAFIRLLGLRELIGDIRCWPDNCWSPTTHRRRMGSPGGRGRLLVRHLAGWQLTMNGPAVGSRARRPNRNRGLAAAVSGATGRRSSSGP